ncbi:helix-turn-helix transcriptional regulator [Bradyrhizobium sp. AZCC 2230]|uniref:helix-turn-helix transcriptional regulator n=1 Tax=Bradyrhizobium sp. AZCC 2230 TaxID=3117021 RepID=UPI00305B1A68
MLGTELRAWRKRHGMTQETLRVELGVSRQTIVVWEQMETPLPRLTELALVALDQVPECRTATGHRYTAAELPAVRENVRMRT